MNFSEKVLLESKMLKIVRLPCEEELMRLEHTHTQPPLANEPEPNSLTGP